MSRDSLRSRTKGVLIVSGQDRKVRLHATEPRSLEHLRRMLWPASHFTTLDTGEPVAAVDALGREVQGATLVLIAQEQPANPANEPGGFLLGDRVINGRALVAARAPDAPVVLRQLNLLRLADAESVMERITFEPRAFEPDPEAPPRCDVSVLRDYLQGILGVLKQLPTDGVVRFVALDDEGTEVGARAFHDWQAVEAKRFALDNYDACLSTTWDGLVRASPPLGTHRATRPVGALVTMAEEEEADCVLFDGTKDLPLKFHRRKLLAPVPKGKELRIPMPGLPFRDKEDAPIVTWTPPEWLNK